MMTSPSKQNRIERAIRLPKDALDQLRTLRDSYVAQGFTTPRSVPDLVRACLRNTEYGVADVRKQTPATRENSEKIMVWLDPEYATWHHKAIVSQVRHVLDCLGGRTIPENIHINKGVV